MRLFLYSRVINSFQSFGGFSSCLIGALDIFSFFFFFEFGRVFGCNWVNSLGKYNERRNERSQGKKLVKTLFKGIYECFI